MGLYGLYGLYGTLWTLWHSMSTYGKYYTALYTVLWHSYE